MKRKLLIQSGVTLVVLFVLAFGVSVKQAYATTGCFTDTVGNWAETFICWMKDNGITSGVTPTTYAPNANVTRAEMAVFMQRQAEVPPSTGDFYFNVGQTQWVPHFFYPTAYIEQYTALSHFRGTTTGVKGFILSPALPAITYGRMMYLKGVRLCYDATPALGGSLTRVELLHFMGGANPSVYKTVLDTTVRNDQACREYLITSPGSIYTTDTIALYIEITLPSTMSYVGIANTSFILSPSAQKSTFGPSPDLRQGLDAPVDPNSGVVNP